jgi:hypothetical protein
MGAGPPGFTTDYAGKGLTAGLPRARKLLQPPREVRSAIPLIVTDHRDLLLLAPSGAGAAAPDQNRRPMARTMALSVA